MRSDHTYIERDGGRTVEKVYSTLTAPVTSVDLRHRRPVSGEIWVWHYVTTVLSL